MERNLPLKKLAALGVLASAAAALAGTGSAAPPPKVEIDHKGNTISVSCNAHDGHLAHADAAEAASLRRAAEECAKIAAR